MFLFVTIGMGLPRPRVLLSRPFLPASQMVFLASFPGRQFEFMVETSYGTAINGLFRAKPIEKKLSMRPEPAGGLLHRFYARAHNSAAPRIEKLSCRVRVDVLPEILEIFLEKTAANAFL